MIVDADTKLKNAMALKDAHIMKPDSMMFTKAYDKNNNPRLKISYYDLDGNPLHESYYLDSRQKKICLLLQLYADESKKSWIINESR